MLTQVARHGTGCPRKKVEKTERSGKARVRTREPDRTQGWWFLRTPDQLVGPELEALAQQQARKKGADKDKVRASTPAMGGGGGSRGRAAHDCRGGGDKPGETDAGSVGPMLEQIEQRTGQLPQHLLADGNHATLADIKQSADKGVEALISVPERMAQAGEQGNHSPEVEAWRQRMQMAEARERYKARAGLVENVNAQVKGRYGLEQLTVRGLAKVKCVALLVALVHNMAAHGPNLVEALRARDTVRPAQAQTHSPTPETTAAPRGDTSPVAQTTRLPGGT